MPSPPIPYAAPAGPDRVTPIRVAVCFGRVPHAPAQDDRGWTWAAWWRGEPQRDPFTRPAILGACSSNEDGLVEARRVAAAFGHEGPVVGLPLEWARAARRQALGKTELWGEQRDEVRHQADQAYDAFAEVARELREEQRRRIAALFDEVLRGAGPSRRPAPAPRVVDALTLAALAALGLAPGATEADIKSAFKRLAPAAHPDRGGSGAAFIELTRARDRALAAVRGG